MSIEVTPFKTKDNHPERLLLRPREAAQALGISERTLWGLDLPQVRVGK